METLSETPTQVVDHPREIADMLEGLTQPGDISLIFEDRASVPHSVLLVEYQEGEHLILDVTAVPEVASGLVAERPFRLSGQASGAMVSTHPMTASPMNGTPGRLRFWCPYPGTLDVWHRRHAFRAELRSGMQVSVEITLDTGETTRTIRGELLNLSLGGCLLQLPLGEAVHLEQGQTLDQVVAIFPSGQRLEARGEVRHVTSDDRWQRALVGFAFDDTAPRFERLVWYLVKEIERESARDAVNGRNLAPSPLFQAPADKASLAAQTATETRYATPMARRLAKVADLINAQVLELKQGQRVDSARLSKASDLLLSLLEQDREAVLFATGCLHREPVIVQHGIAVAARLADLVASRQVPRELLKAVVATALVHDLGKALLPDALLAARQLDEAQYRQLTEHVETLRERLGECRWLAPDVIRSVVVEINERLDGSGYPRGLSGEALSTLGRAAAVVDVMDAMARRRPDRPARGIEAIYRHLLTHGEQFDSQWAQRYIRRFGLQPIGSLVAYTSGAVGWVHRLDEKGNPALVHVVRNRFTPDRRLDQWARGREIERLGRFEQLLDPEGEGLTPC
ncbi:HD domain-containing phosphohydrolase [Modicisalibacter sp. 'Wilcox']|uniref:HD domain-containing phosphohydrolase n=1 Tax=Modicisalibacter sp. 'Wilcox' TaxID=2679914 RepID=UPI0013D51397|nr:HD domain-containing phosphohydrolase [Modicisalibacter sp. 'Wilcox']